MNYRQVSLDRAKELKGRISDYLIAVKKIPKGMELQNEYEESKKKILKILNANESDWNDYKWQLSNRITDVKILSKIISLSNDEVKNVEKVQKKFRWAISPYYASLINSNDKYDPIKLMSVPSFEEISNVKGSFDPMNEAGTNPSGSITRRYPDRLIINTTNECAMYCRHCQRRRNIGEVDEHKSKKVLQESIDYIKENKEIRDVLITGGDPFTMPDDLLEWLISQLHEIKHIDYLRIGTRTIVTMPQRITDKLVNMLKKYHPIYINTQFNHPKEITIDSKKACEKLVNAGISIGNQAVLLNGINNDKHVMKCLNQEMLKVRVRPYYIFQAKHVKGTEHFVTSIDDGLDIMEHLRGYTSGMAIPTYIVNAPGGLGKTPILPQYVISRSKDSFKIRTWEGKVMDIENRPTKEIREIIT